MCRRSLWIINHYAVPPTMPGGTRHFELAKQLAERGWDVTLVASSFHHATRSSEVFDSKRIQVEEIDGVSFVWIPSRTRYRNNGLARVGNMLEFAWRVWRNGRSCFGGRSPQPSAIIGSSPHLLTPWAARRLASVLDARFVFEVRDLWPETFVALGRLPEHHIIVRGLRCLERSLYRSANYIVTLLPGASRYIQHRTGSNAQIIWIPNGADLSSHLSEKPSRNKNKLEVVYVGAHGRANVLDDLIQAAALLKMDEKPTIHITLVGEGPEKEHLQSMATEMGLLNVEFKAGIPKEYVPTVLENADVAVALLEDSRLYDYGISLNKLFDYMASGTPILFAGRVDHDYVALAGCGLSISPRSPEAIAEGLRTFARMQMADLRSMGAAGRTYIKIHHTWDHLANQLGDTLEALCDDSRE
ncbi:glycosyltransferase family 4 protein [Candidatus Bipolaricaulota bacterium]